MAAVLGVSALWLETGKGDRLVRSAKPQAVHEAERNTPVSPALQWITDDEYRLLSNYRAATSGWKDAIQNLADEAEKEPSVRIADNKS